MARKISKTNAKSSDRFDAFINIYSGLGNPNRDSIASSIFCRTTELTDAQLEALYKGFDAAARACDALPEEAMKMGFELKIGADAAVKDDLQTEDYNSEQSDAEREEIRNIMMVLDEHSFHKKLLDVDIFSRVFGGAALYIGADDGLAQMEPLDKENINDILFFRVLDKRDLTVESWYEDPLNPKYDTPEMYRINASRNGLQIKSDDQLIHESRLVVLQGTRASTRDLIDNAGWSESILLKIYETLQQYSVVWQSTSHVMKNQSQAVFKMAGLIESVTKDINYAQNRLAEMDLILSSNNSIVLDSNENEDYKRDAYSFNGVPQILELFMIRMAAAVKLPVAIFNGQTPGGLNSTGESDMRIFYDSVKAHQKDILKPAIEKCVELIFLAKNGPTKGKEPDNWSICFPSLWQMTDLEKAEIRKLDAESRKFNAEADLIIKQAESPPSAPTPTTLDEAEISKLQAETDKLVAEIEILKEIKDA